MLKLEFDGAWCPHVLLLETSEQVCCFERTPPTAARLSPGSALASPYRGSKCAVRAGAQRAAAPHARMLNGLCEQQSKASSSE